MKLIQDGVEFTCDIDIPEDEAKAYIKRALEENPGYRYVQAKIDGDDVELAYSTDAIPFERIRRITGYLVGTLDRFNDGKRAEERDRVKHEVACG